MSGESNLDQTEDEYHFFVTAIWDDGPLGVSLHYENSNIVANHVNPGSVAENLGVQYLDELWRINDESLKHLDASNYKSAILQIKSLPKPVTLTWRRKDQTSRDRITPSSQDGSDPSMSSQENNSSTTISEVDCSMIPPESSPNSCIDNDSENEIVEVNSDQTSSQPNKSPEELAQIEFQQLSSRLFFREIDKSATSTSSFAGGFRLLSVTGTKNKNHSDSSSSHSYIYTPAAQQLLSVPGRRLLWTSPSVELTSFFSVTHTGAVTHYITSHSSSSSSSSSPTSSSAPSTPNSTPPPPPPTTTTTTSLGWGSWFNTLQNNNNKNNTTTMKNSPSSSSISSIASSSSSSSSPRDRSQTKDSSVSVNSDSNHNKPLSSSSLPRSISINNLEEEGKENNEIEKKVEEKEEEDDDNNYHHSKQQQEKQNESDEEAEARPIYPTRTMILCNDLFIVAAPYLHDCLQIELMVDLHVTKIKDRNTLLPPNNDEIKTQFNSSSSTPSSSYEQDIDISNPSLYAIGSTPQLQPYLRLYFELISPMCTYQLHFPTEVTKLSILQKIFVTICELAQDTISNPIGWRHNYLLGSIHSAVLHRDEGLVFDYITAVRMGCTAVDFENEEDNNKEEETLESKDEDGYTALHYAVIFQYYSIINQLHSALVDVKETDNRGLTPIHWAALNLDSQALGILTSNIFDSDLLDREGRTVLQLAVIEGRSNSNSSTTSSSSSSSRSDMIELNKCMKILLAMNADVNVLEDGVGLSLLHYVSADWQYESIELLLGAGADVNFVDLIHGFSPLHFAIRGLSLRRPEGEGSRIKRGAPPILRSLSLTLDTSIPSEIEPPIPSILPFRDPTLGIQTIKILLANGSRPNGKDFKGKTPLQLLSEYCDASWSPLSSLSSSLSTDPQDHLTTSHPAREILTFLLSSGARFDDSPQCSFLKSRFSTSTGGSGSGSVGGSNLDAIIETWNNSPTINADQLDVKSLSPPTSLPTTSPLNSSPSSLSSSSHSQSPSSNSSSPPSPPTCLLCGVGFTLFRRQHHCRVCTALCCDSCSKRRSILHNSEVRTCDCCYNQLSSLHLQRSIQSQIKPLPAGKYSSSSSSSSPFTSNTQQQPYDSNSKNALFQTSSSSTTTKSQKQQQQQTPIQQSNDSLSSTISTLQETHQRLQERGEKLNKLSDKSADMANAARDFEKLARQIKEQQKSTSWF